MKDCLYKIQTGMEHIFQDDDPITRITKQFFRSRAAASILSVVTAVSVYGYCVPLAYLERGGKTAYGGECLAALTAGFVVWRLVSDWRAGNER